MDFINIVNVNLIGRVKTGFLRHVSRPILRRIVAPRQKKGESLHSLPPAPVSISEAREGCDVVFCTPSPEGVLSKC